MAGRSAGIIRKGTVLFWLAVVSAALMAFELVSGIILWFVLPSGQGARLSGSASVWGLDRHTWIDLHDWASLMLIAVVIAHVAMHWKWVVRQTRARITGRRVVALTHEASGESA